MSQSTAVAVLVDTITTIVGFGSLMIASHRGLQSLGRVLTIGVSCCMFTSLIMLPALLTWMSWNRKDDEDETLPGGEHVRHSASAEGIIWRRDDTEFPSPAPHVGAERIRPNIAA
jgi:predicted RND superfamily exporter protein